MLFVSIPSRRSFLPPSSGPPRPFCWAARLSSNPIKLEHSLHLLTIPTPRSTVRGVKKSRKMMMLEKRIAALQKPSSTQEKRCALQADAAARLTPACPPQESSPGVTREARCRISDVETRKQYQVGHMCKGPKWTQRPWQTVMKYVADEGKINSATNGCRCRRLGHQRVLSNVMVTISERCCRTRGRREI